MPPDAWLYSSVLGAVFVVDIKELSQHFLDWDTSYAEEGKTKHYDLPKGKVLVLLIVSGGMMIWTTIRRFTPEKERYYRSIVGQEVQIIIE